MLHRQINPSKDLQKLANDGYEVETKNSFILIHNIPYLDSDCNILYGTLISNVSYNNKQKPNHVIHFEGKYPCNKDGSPILQIQHQQGNFNLGNGISANFAFSNKPSNGYDDYYHKFTQYIRIISSPAESVDRNVTARNFKPLIAENEVSVLRYLDTNSSRSEINAINNKLANQKIAIIGLGGTGSYVLEFISKTEVNEIHLFDGDQFLQHNAFRTPGAASVEDLNGCSKVEYLHRVYSKMHKNIIPNNLFISEANVGMLSTMDFVFICIDRGEIKKVIFKKLEELGIPFIDTGLGVEKIDDSLNGTIRTTTSFELNREHVYENKISFTDNLDDDYSSNIQIAELNALNAIFAIVKWKKLLGFYIDQENEYNSLFTISTNQLLSDDV